MPNWVMIDMNNKNALTSMALMQVLYDQRGMDYLDVLKPFFKVALSTTDVNVQIDINEIKRYMFTEFGIEVPTNVILMLAGRLTREKLLKKQRGVFYRTNSNLNVDKFIKEREKMYENQKQLCDAYIDFCKKENMDITPDQATELLLNYISRYAAKQTEVNSICKLKKSDEYQLGKFIFYINENNPVLFHIAEYMIRGCWIANTIYLVNDNQNFNMGFNDLTIYIDTSLLIYALGYAVKEQAIPCREMIDIAKNLGIKLKCFRHNIDEVDGILEGCLRKIRTKDFIVTRKMEYFIKNNKTESDILLYKSNLEKNIESLGISIENVPDYGNIELVIDHKALKNHLMDNMGECYKEISCERDVDSVAAIYRLRNNHSSKRIENCKALFVTSNYSLANNVNNFMSAINNGYRLVITDVALTNVLWLKTPDKMPDIVQQRIIADAYAAIQPTEDFWNKLSERIEKLVEQGSITYADSLEFRTAAYYQAEILEQTHGDVDKIECLPIQEIINLHKEEEHAQLLQEKRALELQAKKQEKDYERKLNEKSEQIEKSLQIRSSKYAKRVMLVVKLLEIIVAGVIIGATILGAYFDWLGWCTLNSGLVEVAGIPTRIITIIIGLFGINGFRKYCGKKNEKMYEYIKSSKYSNLKKEESL